MAVVDEMAAIEQWHDFYVATAGAAAALVGLTIVAITITLKVILASPSLPSRAFSTISMLTAIIIVSGLALFPQQAFVSLGVELLACGVLALIPQFYYTWRLREEKYKFSFFENLSKLALGYGPIVPLIVGSILLIAVVPAGLYWIAIGVLLAFLASMINTWVLLVEIQR